MLNFPKNMAKNFIDIKEFLFNNKSVRQTIFKNVFWLSLAEGVSRLLTFVLFIYIARILGATEYGKFTFALAFVYLLSIFSDLGISQITTREFSREKEMEKDYPAILSLKFFLILGTLILVLISSFFTISDPVIKKIIWILALYVFGGSFAQIIYAFLAARQRMEYEAWSKILQTFLFVAFGSLVIFIFPSAENLALGYLVATLIFLSLLLLFFHFKVYKLKFAFSPAIWQKFLNMSWPLALSALFVTIYSEIDSVMMGYLGQITQTGWYNAAYRITGFTLIPMALFSQSFFPVLSKAFKESKEKLQNIWNYQMKAMIILAIPIMTGGIFLSRKIIYFVYNPEYTPSILVFQILIIMAGIIFLSSPFNGVLIASNQQKKIFWVTMAGAFANIILNLILIPKFSLYGAAVATVITQFLVFLLLIQLTLKLNIISFFNLKILLTLIGAGISSGIMYFIITRPQIYHLHVIFSVLIGIIVYFLILFCFFSFLKLKSSLLKI